MQRQFSRVSVAGLKEAHGKYTALRPEQSRRWKTPDGSESETSARFVRFYTGFRIWVTGCPVVRREGHVPEHRIRQRELHSHLWVLAPPPVYMGDNTLQHRFCLGVRQSEPLSSVHREGMNFGKLRTRNGIKLRKLQL